VLGVSVSKRPAWAHLDQSTAILAAFFVLGLPKHKKQGRNGPVPCLRERKMRPLGPRSLSGGREDVPGWFSCLGGKKGRDNNPSKKNTAEMPCFSCLEGRGDSWSPCGGSQYLYNVAL